jgi:1L-myo-inositol 1-phosphate cytidylyltransferase / CDP-L-myo-inositol myo-inositolphosphotransferase
MNRAAGLTVVSAPAVAARSMLVVVPALHSVPPDATIAGLPLLSRIVLTAERAGFNRTLVHPLACPDAGLLEGTEARILGADRQPRPGSPVRVVLLPANVLPRVWWLQSLREMPLSPDTLAMDGSRTAAIETSEAGDLLDAAARATTIDELIAAWPGLARAWPLADSDGRFTLGTVGEVAAARDWLLRGLVRDAEGFISRHLERRLSLALTRRLVVTRITPNAMTLVSLAVGLLGAPFFLSAEWSYQLTGSLLFLAHSILDGCDGELARLKFLESRTGALLDFWGDNLVHVAVFGHMAVGWALAVNAVWPLLLGVLAVTGTAAAALSMMSRQAIRTRKFGGDLTGRVTKALANRDFIYLVILLALFGKAHWFLVLVAAGSPIFVMLAWLADRADRTA